MVVGLDIFRQHFAEHTDAFVLIGGTAISICMENQGLAFRATKDLDIVLLIDVLDGKFFERFWQFIRSGRYEISERTTGSPILFRFSKPVASGYPVQIELFGIRPDNVSIPENYKFTPIPAGDGLSSLSAILLDDEYYEYIKSTRLAINGLSVTPPKTLIPLKARAYLDLAKRKLDGGAVDDKAIKKHKNDVFRVFQLLTENDRGPVPKVVADDLSDFLAAVGAEPPDLKSLDIRNTTFDEVTSRIRDIFQI